VAQELDQSSLGFHQGSHRPKWRLMKYLGTVLIVLLGIILVLLFYQNKRYCSKGETWNKELHMCIADCPPMGCVR
jgi:hypothetical protein